MVAAGETKPRRVEDEFIIRGGGADRNRAENGGGGGGGGGGLKGGATGSCSLLLPEEDWELDPGSSLQRGSPG